MFMAQIHPYLPNTELLLWCKEKNIHVTAYAPLGNVNKEFASCLDDPVIIEIAERMTKSPAQVMYNTPTRVNRIEPTTTRVELLLQVVFGYRVNCK